MKKETVNVFDGGLNKDLNPLVTPNNVLTDNLNGTFLTFNGDELSLQNDAGNTKIAEEGGEVGKDFVRLSDGFSPIGMKEYGGILYIVSGKKGYNDLGQRVKELDEIEFGSYPSPSNSGYKTFHGQKTIELVYDKDRQNILYKSFIINNDYFKTGRYITFNIVDDINLDVSNVQTDKDNTKLYIIKLYLQLDNGVIDLTNDVWTKFNYYKTQNPDDTATHWLLSPGFEYYCPYSYNGRLSIKTVMSEPTVELTKTSVTENDSGIYSLDFDVNIKDTEALSVDKCILKYWYKSGEPIYLKKLVGGDGSEFLKQGINSFTIESIPGNKEILYYEIMPYFKYKGTALSWEDFPLEFQQLYMNKGTVMLADKFKDVGFSNGDYECVPNKGIRKVKELILEGRDGFLSPLDLEYISEGDKPYAFFLSGHSNPHFISLGTYTIKNGYVDIENITQTAEEASRLDMTSDIYTNVIKPVLQNTLVEIFDSSCSSSILKLRFSAPLDMTDPKTLKNGTLTIFQDIKGSVNNLEYESADGRNFNVKINAFENVTLSFDHPGFGSFNYTINKEVLNTDKVYEIGLVVNFEMLVVNRGDLQKTNYFETPILDKSIFELGSYIHDKFSTNISDRYQITPQDSHATYSFDDQRISYAPYLGNFNIVVTDLNYLDRWRNAYTVAYIYKLTDSNGEVLKSNIAEGEYAVITRAYDYLSTIQDKYIKIGTDNLGYILFKIEDNYLRVRLSSYLR